MLAVKQARFPKLVGDKIDYKSMTSKKLPLVAEPVSVTVLKIGDHFIVDPITEEEKAMDARLTVAVLKDNTLCAMQKGGEMPLSQKDIETMIDIATEKAKEIRKYLK